MQRVEKLETKVAMKIQRIIIKAIIPENIVRHLT
jgi:hypothetical protein